MLTEVCAKLRNYFCLEGDKVFGDFSIVDGKLTPPVGLEDGQYYRIVGSVFSDGVHRSSDFLSHDEDFHGAVWKMRVPKDVLDIVDEIEEWQKKYGDVDSQNMSPYTSESFGGYSYSKGYGGSGQESTGSGTTWESAFMSRLSPYRRIRL